MTPDDPRHATVAGYRAGCRDYCCTEASRRYEARRRYERFHGARRLVPNIGTRRRIEALATLGWSVAELGDQWGVTRQQVRKWRVKPVILATTAARVADTYERLCMKAPPTSTIEQRISVAKTKATARRRGWQPPLAWDDIDNDPEPRDGQIDKFAVDEIVIERILNGHPTPCTRAERLEVIRRWKALDRPLNQLEQITGWNTRREIREAA